MIGVACDIADFTDTMDLLCIWGIAALLILAFMILVVHILSKFFGIWGETIDDEEMVTELRESREEWRVDTDSKDQEEDGGWEDDSDE